MQVHPLSSTFIVRVIQKPGRCFGDLIDLGTPPNSQIYRSPTCKSVGVNMIEVERLQSELHKFRLLALAKTKDDVKVTQAKLEQERQVHNMYN